MRVEGFYNRHAETMSRDELERLKLERLKWTVRHAYENVRFYREAMRERGITPDDIKTLDDLRKLGIEYQITLTREKGLDVMKLTVELASPDVPEAKRKELAERIRREIAENLMVDPVVELVNPMTLPRQEVGKAKRVIDMRT